MKDMKFQKYLFPVLLFCLAIGVYAQQQVPVQQMGPGQPEQKKYEYSTESNIRYYGDDIYRNDDYAKERCVLDIYYPKNISNCATIIWFHGGGLTSGNKAIPGALKDKGYCIVGAGYRLSPKVNAPKCIEDAAAVTAWVFKNISKYGGDPNLIFISGHSAGGYLTLMIGLNKKYLNVYGIDANNIAALIPLSPQCITHFTIRQERGIKDTQAIIDEYAPIYYARADAPPLLLITGDREKEFLGRYEENAYLMRMMKLNGHKATTLYEMDGYGHDMVLPGLPLLLDEVRTIVNEKTTVIKKDKL
jgi:acetyl esterase/lipase